MKTNFFLKYCSAVELGAYNAYTHHAKATNDTEIYKIAQEELDHHRTLNGILKSRESKDAPILSALIGLCGSVLGYGCYIFPKVSLNYVAYVLELINIINYSYLIKLLPDHAITLQQMLETESRHEQYFKREKQ